MNATQEEWRPVVGWEGFYEVSDRGRVRSLPRYVRSRGSGQRLVPGRIRKLQTHKQGYKMVALRQDARYSFRLVHQLVLTAFVGTRPDGSVSCHNDGDPANNHVDNLRWDTQASNILDSVRHGTHQLAGATHCKRGHEFTRENTKPASGWRACRKCANDSRRRRYKRYGTPPGERTHCPRGHEYNDENTFVNRQDRRECRTCMRQRQKARRARLRAEGLPVT